MSANDTFSQALQKFLKGEQRDLDLIIRNLQSPSCKDSYMADMLGQLKNCASQLDRDKFEPAVGALLSLEWTKRSNQIIQTYQKFVVNLISAYSVYTDAVLKSLITMFLPKNAEKLGSGDTEQRRKLEEELCHVHNLILAVIKSVPLALQNLPKLIAEKFPYMLHKQSVLIELYIQNILKLTLYASPIRAKILSMVVEKLIFLDVRASRERIEELQSDSEDEEEDDLQDMEIFQMEADNPAKDKTPTNNLIEADRLDISMCTLFAFIDNIAKDKDGSVNWDTTKTLYLEFLSIFESIIFPTHECCHTQFLLFYICSLKQSLSDGILDFLWKKVKNPNEHQVYRKAAVCYMASFIVRAKYISIRSAADAITLMCEWIHKYIRTASANSMHCDIVHHGPFYAVVQSVFYMLAFRQREFLEMDKAHVFFTSLNLQTIVTCKLNPLRVCQPVITRTFSAFVRKHQLAFCDAIIERNNRMVIPMGDGSGDSSLTAQFLESYFPFDPYLLVRSESMIASMYRTFEGNAIVEVTACKIMMDDAEDDFVRNDENAMSTSYIKSPTADAFLGSVSPGFNMTSHLHPPR